MSEPSRCPECGIGDPLLVTGQCWSNEMNGKPVAEFHSPRRKLWTYHAQHHEKSPNCHLCGPTSQPPPPSQGEQLGSSGYLVDVPPPRVDEFISRFFESNCQSGAEDIDTFLDLAAHAREQQKRAEEASAPIIHACGHAESVTLIRYYKGGRCEMCVQKLEHERDAAEKRAEEVEGGYQKMISAVLNCSPLPAKDRPDDQLEPPWDVIRRMKRERDEARAELLALSCAFKENDEIGSQCIAKLRAEVERLRAEAHRINCECGIEPDEHCLALRQGGKG